MTADAVGALDGLVIADFGRVLAGPYATMILADLGAEVVKIERPGVGDDTRSWGPPWVGDESSYFLSVNRNKKSVTLDLREREDLESARELVRNADVVVQNFLPGTMDRLGLGYDAVREMNPRCGLLLDQRLRWQQLSAGIRPVDSGGRRIDEYHRTRSQDSHQGRCRGGRRHHRPACQRGNPCSAAPSRSHRRRAARRGQSVVLVAVRTGQPVVQLRGRGAWCRRQWATGIRASHHTRYSTPRTVRWSSRSAMIGNSVSLTEVLGVSELAADARFASNSDRVAHREELFDAVTAALAKGSADSWFEGTDRARVFRVGLSTTSPTR